MTNSSLGGNVKELGSAVKQARRKMGLSTETLAQASHVSASFIETLEKGSKSVINADISEFLKVLRTLHMEANRKTLLAALKVGPGVAPILSIQPEETREAWLDRRRESMIDILASWELEDAVPDEAGMIIVRRYVSGQLSLEEAIEEMKKTPLPGRSTKIDPVD